MPQYRVCFFVLARVNVEREILADSQEAALDQLAASLDFDKAIGGICLPDNVDSVTFAGGIDCAHVQVDGDAQGLFTRYYRPGPDGLWQVMQEPGDGQVQENEAA